MRPPLSCALLPDLPRHRHEAHRQDPPLLERSPRARDDQELLPLVAHRDHQPAAVLELPLSGSGIRGAAAVTMIASNGASSGQPW